MNKEYCKLNWQPLNMIPVMHEMTEEMLKGAEMQLTNLKQSSHLLDDLIIKNLINAYTKKQQIIPRYLEQCKRWQEETLNRRQLTWVKTSKYTSETLKTTLAEILALARKFEKKNIDKLLQKDDTALI